MSSSSKPTHSTAAKDAPSRSPPDSRPKRETSSGRASANVDSRIAVSSRMWSAPFVATRATPSGRRTRASSAIARGMSGTWYSMWLATTTSATASGSGIDWASVTTPTAMASRPEARVSAAATIAADWSVSTYRAAGHSPADSAHIDPVPQPTSTTVPPAGQVTRRGSHECHGTAAVDQRACRRVRASRLAVSPYWTSRRYAWSPPAKSRRLGPVRSRRPRGRDA